MWKLKDMEIEGYGKYHTASKSSKGGTAIYVKNNFDTIERCDLNISNVEFETTWIEIKNKNSKNIVVVVFIDIHTIILMNFTSTLKCVWVVLQKKIKKFIYVVILI